MEMVWKKTGEIGTILQRKPLIQGKYVLFSFPKLLEEDEQNRIRQRLRM